MANFYLRIKDNIVEKIYTGDRQPEGTIEYQLPNTPEVRVGNDIRFFDSELKLKSAQQCVNEGLLQPREDEKVVFRNSKYKIVPKDPDAVWSEEEQRWYVPSDIKAQRIRGERDSRLQHCDFIVMPDYPINESELDEWKAYRQTLRDITKQPTFPDSVEWPTAPPNDLGI